MMSSTEFLVIGGGPAGIFAALQAQERGTSCLLVSDESLGGMTAAAEWITNLPDFPEGIRGADYAEYLARLVSEAGLRHCFCRIDRLSQSANGFEAFHNRDVIQSRAVALATGTLPARIDMPGLRNPALESVIHRDIRSMPSQLKGSSILIIGGGEAAVDSALSLKDRGAGVTIICRKNCLSISEKLSVRLAEKEIRILFNSEVAGLEKNNNKQGTARIISEHWDHKEFNHVLLCVGRTPRSELWGQISEHPFPSTVETHIPGLFLAGDLIQGRNRYIPRAIKDGMEAAQNAMDYLQGHYAQKE